MRRSRGLQGYGANSSRAVVSPGPGFRSWRAVSGSAEAEREAGEEEVGDEDGGLTRVWGAQRGRSGARIGRGWTGKWREGGWGGGERAHRAWR